MFCPNCGAQVQPDQLFCNQCGTRQPIDELAPQPAAAEPVAQPAAEPVVQPVQPAQPIQQAQPVQPVVQPVVQQVVQPAPVVIVQQEPKPVRGPFNAVAIVSLALGILAVIFFWFPYISWIFCLSGLICAIIALVNVKKKNARNKGFAIGGLITSILGTSAVAIYVLIIILLGASSLIVNGAQRSAMQAWEQEYNDYYT